MRRNLKVVLPVLIIIVGIIGGMLIGNAIEAAGNIHDATEYVIKTSTGALFTVAQVDQGNPNRRSNRGSRNTGTGL